MANVRVVLNRQNVRKLLQSPEVQAKALELAEKSAAAANAEGVGTFEASVVVGKNRAHASVIAADRDAIFAELHNLTLTRSIDAARE